MNGLHYYWRPLLNSSHFEELPEEHKHNREIIRIIAKNDSNIILKLPQFIRKDKNFMLELVRLNTRCIVHVVNDICDDEEALLSLANCDLCIFGLASARLRNTRRFILKVAKLQQVCLSFAGKKWRDKKETAIIMLATYGEDLCYTSETLKDDDEVVDAAVKSYPLAFLMASKRFHSNPIYIANAINSMLCDGTFFYLKKRLTHNDLLDIHWPLIPEVLLNTRAMQILTNMKHTNYKNWCKVPELCVKMIKLNLKEKLPAYIYLDLIQVYLE